MAVVAAVAAAAAAEEDEAAAADRWHSRLRHHCWAPLRWRSLEVLRFLVVLVEKADVELQRSCQARCGPSVPRWFRRWISYRRQAFVLHGSSNELELDVSSVVPSVVERRGLAPHTRRRGRERSVSSSLSLL